MSKEEYNNAIKHLCKVYSGITSDDSNAGGRLAKAVESIRLSDSFDFFARRKKYPKAPLHFNRKAMYVFPPYNESLSEANKLATRWAHRADVNFGDSKLISFGGNWYLIVKNDDGELGYQIIKSLSKKEFYIEFKELKKHEQSEDRCTIEERINRINTGYKRSNSFGRAGSSVDADKPGFERKNTTIRGLGSEQTDNERKKLERNGNGDSSSSSENRQGNVSGQVETKLDADFDFSIYDTIEEDIEDMTPESIRKQDESFKNDQRVIQKQELPKRIKDAADSSLRPHLRFLG